MDYGLDLSKWIDFDENKEVREPKVRIPFSLDTTYCKQDFNLDLVVWHLKEENLEQTKKVANYVLTNFNRLFETAWTAFYYFYYDNINCELDEFFQMVNFEDDDYFTIQVEINSDYLMDGIARYHFVVNTDDNLSDDNVRLYMRDNKCCACDTNNEASAILMSANFEDIVPEMAEGVRKSFEKQYDKMEQEQILFAPPFGE